MHEDLPAPVAPAMRTCGNSVNRRSLGVPDTSMPKLTSIGSWSGGATYPGNETVYANEGLFRYADGCTGTLSIEAARKAMASSFISAR